MNTDMFNLDNAIRKVPDFPKPGILFYDITSVLINPQAFRYCLDKATHRFAAHAIDAIVGIDARGFIFAAPIAYCMQKPLVLVRKNGKLPGETYRRSFALEYGEDTIEVHKADIHNGMNVLIVDDLIATGGTLKATAEMVTIAGATVVGIFGVIGLSFLDYRRVLHDYHVETLIDYQTDKI